MATSKRITGRRREPAALRITAIEHGPRTVWLTPVGSDWSPRDRHIRAEAVLSRRDLLSRLPAADVDCLKGLASSTGASVPSR